MTAFLETILAAQNTTVFVSIVLAAAASGVSSPRAGFAILLAWLLLIGLGVVVPL